MGQQSCVVAGMPALVKQAGPQLPAPGRSVCWITYRFGPFPLCCTSMGRLALAIKHRPTGDNPTSPTLPVLGGLGLLPVSRVSYTCSLISSHICRPRRHIRILGRTPRGTGVRFQHSTTSYVTLRQAIYLCRQTAACV